MRRLPLLASLVGAAVVAGGVYGEEQKETHCTTVDGGADGSADGRTADPVA